MAARGGVDRIGLVISYDMPFDARLTSIASGGPGAGRNGEAVLFVTPRERRFISNLERATGQPIEAGDPGMPRSTGRLDRLRQRSIRQLETGEPVRRNRIAQELIQRISTELELTPEQMALAALNLAIIRSCSVRAMKVDTTGGSWWSSP